MAPPGCVEVGAVYVHAPFCARRCVYCDFAVTVRREGDLPSWGQALAAELDQVDRDGEFALAPELDSLYVGGGTPSLLGSGACACTPANMVTQKTIPSVIFNTLFIKYSPLNINKI